MGSYIARLVEAGVQKYGEPLDPCWLYAVLSSGYKHFVRFSDQAPGAERECASLYPDPYLGTLFVATSGRRAVFRPLSGGLSNSLFPLVVLTPRLINIGWAMIAFMACRLGVVPGLATWGEFRPPRRPRR